MPELRDHRLVESLATALETTGFVSLSPPAEALQPPPHAVLLRVEFHGPKHGRIEMVTSVGLGLQLLQNTLGCDSSETLVFPNPRDPLVEIANITCGLLLKSFGFSCGFDTSVPRVEPFDAAQWPSFVNDQRCDVVDADGFAVAIRLFEE